MIAPADRVVADLTDELVAAGGDVDEVLGLAVSTLSRARPGTWVALLMNRDPSTSRVFLTDQGDARRSAWFDLYMSTRFRRGMIPTVGMVRNVIDSGEPMLVPSVGIERYLEMMTAAAREWYAEHPAPPEMRTIGTVIVPMRGHGQTIGTLQFIAWNADALDSGDVRWVRRVADRVGMVVDHALSYATSVALLERLTALGNVAQAVAASQDLRLTLQLILENIASRLAVDAADVLLVDEGSNEMYLGAAVGFRSLLAPDFRVPIPADLTEASLLGRRFDRRHDARTDPEWPGQFRRRSLFAREGFRSYRGVSMLAQGRLVGMLEIFHRSSLEIDQEWLAFLDAMGAQAAIAVFSAGLRDAAQEAALNRRPASQRPDLSSLEWRILAQVVDGATNREIAGNVHLSENTIKFHIRRLLDRLGAVNRTDLARKVTQSAWL